MQEDRKRTKRGKEEARKRGKEKGNRREEIENEERGKNEERTKRERGRNEARKSKDTGKEWRKRSVIWGYFLNKWAESELGDLSLIVSTYLLCTISISSQYAHSWDGVLYVG